MRAVTLQPWINILLIFTPGQRWVSDTESDLGLGLVTHTDLRTVTLEFAVSQETRTYSLENPPLTRVRFAPGDIVTREQNGRLKIERVEDVDGLLVYVGRPVDGDDADAGMVLLPETQLDSFLQITNALDRLLGAQLDSNQWFSLRYQTLIHQRFLPIARIHRHLSSPRKSQYYQYFQAYIYP